MANNEYPAFAQEVARRPIAQIDSYKRQERPVFGFNCSYVPEELLHAMGIIPVRLIGGARDIQSADRYFQSYCCSQVRSLMEDFVNGVYDNLDGVIFAHTCDTMQSFHDIFKKTFPTKFVKNINFPSRIDGEVPFRYTVAETKRFLRSIEEFTGRPLDAAKLKESVDVYNKTRSLLDRLYSLHLKHPKDIPGRVVLHSVLSSMFMDKDEFNRRLAPFVESFDESKAEDSSLKRIMLVGNINVSDEIHDLAEEYGAIIADDDMCTGRRYFSTLVAEPTIEGVARRYLNRPHCAAKHRDVHSRERYLLELAKNRKINGVIFLYLKFCDPHCFDYPDLKVALEGKGLPSQLIEVEQTAGQSGQLRTKIQAFVEMMSN